MDSAPNLVLVGPTGAGKTLLGTRLAERFGLRFVDVDAAIQADAGATVADIFAREGEAGFRDRERDVLAALLAGSGQVIATGGGAVLHPDNRDLMQLRGFVVWLHAGVQAQLQRLAGTTDRPLLQGADREAVLQAMAAERTPLYDRVANLRFDTHGLAPDEAAATLAAQVAARWYRGPA